MRPIPGFDRYFCDARGNVFSNKTRDRSYRAIKPKLSNSGYLNVHLRTPGKDHGAFVHRLVLMTWGTESGEGLHCNHKNGDKTDNRIENLEWVTACQNQQHAIRVLGRKLGKPHYGTKNASAKLNPEQVRRIRTRAAEGALQYELAREYGVSGAVISSLVRRKTWAHVD